MKTFTILNKNVIRKLMATPRVGLTALFLLFAASLSQAVTKNATTIGNWSTLTWSPAGVPAAGDDIIINNGITVTVDGTITCNSLTFFSKTSGGAGVTGTLTVNSPNSLTVTNAITAPSGKADGTFTITGTGTINSATLAVNDAVAPGGSAINLFTLNSTITTLNVTGNVSLVATGSAKFNNPTLNLQSGTLSIGGTITVTTTANASSAATLNMNSGAASGTLILSGTTPWSVTQGAGSTLTITLNGTGATVNYNATAAQAVLAATYTNLVLSGSGAKTTTGATVNGILSMEGTATASAVPTYGAGATLQYNTATTRTAGVEWLTPFAGTGGIIIANTGTITMNSDEVFNASVPLTINSGATLATGNFQLTFGGNFVNNGTFTGGSSNIVIANTATAQSIDGFTTTGTVSMTKTAGTATFTGNVNGGAFTLSGLGGTLDLGAGLTHTFTGTWTRTNGTLLGNSSTLNLAGTTVNTAGTFTANTSTINYNGTGAQTVNALNYFNLTISGARTTNSVTLASAGTIGIAETFTASATFTSGVYVNTTSLVDYNGTGAQTITAFNYNDLTISGARTTNNVTLASSGTIGIAGTLTASATFTTGAYVNTTSSVDYNGTGAQTIIAFNYNNLTISGARTTNSVTLANAGTISVAGTLTASATFTSGAYVNTSSTVDYNGTGAQTITAFNYNDLTISGARTTNNLTFASSGTIGVASTLSLTATFTSGSHVTTGSTVDYNGGGAQTITATSATFVYNHLNLSNGGAKTAGGALTVNGDLTYSGTATFAAGTSLTHTFKGNWIINTTAGTPFSFVTASTINFNAPATPAATSLGGTTVASIGLNIVNINNTSGFTLNVNISASGNLTVASNVTLTPAAAVVVSGGGTLTGSGTVKVTRTAATPDFISQYTITTKTLTNLTVDYDATGAQTVNALNYFNLTISGARTTNSVTLASAGTIGVAGVFTASSTFTTGAYVNTTSTVDYNGTGAQTIIAFNYNSLTISGARTTNNVTLAISGTIGIAGSFTASATFSSGAYVITTSTVDYNGTGAQTITAFNYNNVQTGTGGVKTAGGTLQVYGNLIIGASTTFDASSTTDTIYGNWTNNGTFTPSTSSIVLASSGATTIIGATTFNTLEAGKSTQNTAINLSNNVTTATLTMTSGTIYTGSNSITITSTRTGNGIIIGTITRTHSFLANTSYEFESPNTTINFTNSGTLPTSMSVTVVLDSTAITNTYMDPINRYYDISQVGGSGFQYKLQLHYEDSELGSANSETTPPLRMWRDSSGVWLRMGVNSNSTVSNWVQWDSVVTLGKFSLSSRTIANVVLTLASNATNPVPGDQVTYTISYNNSGDGNATNVLVVAPVPFYTTYVLESITVNGIAQPDATSGITVGPSAISFNLSTLLGNSILPTSSGTVTYKVVIN